MAVPLDRFLRFDELTAELHRLVAEHPDVATVESIGRSHEGRDVWLVTVTDPTTGGHDTKPAHWVDANIHAVELTGSVAALHLIDTLLTGYGTDDRITRALRTRTFYVVPRVNPDGAEWAMADCPKYVRSSTRPWPWRDGHTPSGLQEHDLDGDGRVLLMRVPDPDGAWRPHGDEPRLMVPRRPDDGPGDGPGDGPFYRLLAEGTVADHDGFTIPYLGVAEGLDLNRNYPAGWGSSVRGAGDFPTSEPEIGAVVRAMVARPNICGFNAYHTSGGVLLRPSSTRADSSLPPVDVWVWKELGRQLTETSGYQVHSVFEDFTWDKESTMSGASDDWAYEHLGVYGWTTEFWDPISKATDHRAPTHIWYTGPSVEDELAVLRWADGAGLGRLYVDWYPFDHPQLGPVELGGWDTMQSWVNPPSELLAAEVRPHADFAVFHALAAPEIELKQLRAAPLGDAMWRVTAGIANTGWLPTYVTEHAKKHNLVLPLVAELTGAPDADVTVVDAPARRELGQLAGRVGFRLDGGHHVDATPDRVMATWLVRAPAGTTVTVEARHPRAGRASASIVLWDAPAG